MAVLDLRTSYLKSAYDDAGKLISEAKKELAEVEFDTMVGTGLSGSLVIPILARAFYVPWLLVRKPNDGSHSSMEVEGQLGERWIFVDDFISSGHTLARVHRVVGEQVEQANRERFITTYNSVCVGAYLYQYEGDFRPYKDLIETINFHNERRD